VHSTSKFGKPASQYSDVFNNYVTIFFFWLCSLRKYPASINPDTAERTPTATLRPVDRPVIGITVKRDEVLVCPKATTCPVELSA
jgi:hypothetical protein